jgi:hypothetical protein
MITRRATLLGGLSAGLAGPALASMPIPENGIIVVPIRMTSERLWTFMELSPGDQYFAVFDSGSLTNMIATEMALRLKLDFQSGLKIAGLGGTEQGRWVPLENPIVGGAFQPDKWWFLTTKTLDKQHFKLIIGAQILTYFNSEFDMTRAEWRIYHKAPMNFDGYTKIPNSYVPVQQSYTPEFQLNCSVGGFSGKFHFDTGSPTNFVLDGAASAKLKLWDSDQPYAPWRIGGFGPNRINSRLYRVKNANINGLELEQPLVMLSQPNRSTSIIDGFDGLVGLKAIRHFNVLFDAKGRSLWLKANGLKFEDQDGRYPMSGLWLDNQNDMIVVEEVGIGSPAAVAGVAVGDKVVGTDWRTIMTRLNGDAGETVAMQIERGGKTMSIEFTLQPYL